MHRDLKSPNLLVDDNWRVKVADFNLSKFLGDTFLGEEGAARRRSSLDKNNPRWIAPEVLRGEAAAEAADVFSMGVVLWELLVGAFPWGGAERSAIRTTVLAGGRLAVPAPEDLPGGVATAGFAGLPRYLALMRCCWAQEPRERPDFGEVAEELAALLALADPGELKLLM